MYPVIVFSCPLVFCLLFSSYHINSIISQAIQCRLSCIHPNKHRPRPVCSASCESAIALHVSWFAAHLTVTTLSFVLRHSCLTGRQGGSITTHVREEEAASSWRDSGMRSVRRGAGRTAERTGEAQREVCREGMCSECVRVIKCVEGEWWHTVFCLQPLCWSVLVKDGLFSFSSCLLCLV